jgi:excisionase family DNA binding protein
MLLTLDECAAYTKLAKKTIYHYSHFGRIPTVKIGGKLLFSYKEIEKWVILGADVKACQKIVGERNYKKAGSI